MSSTCAHRTLVCCTLETTSLVGEGLRLQRHEVEGCSWGEASSGEEKQVGEPSSSGRGEVLSGWLLLPTGSRKRLSKAWKPNQAWQLEADEEDPWAGEEQQLGGVAAWEFQALFRCQATSSGNRGLGGNGAGCQHCVPLKLASQPTMAALSRDANTV